MISRIFLGLAMRATPPSTRICAGTRSRAITETAPAFSAISAWRASVTSMMTPPLSISARPVLRRREVFVLLPLFWDMVETLWIPFRDREESAVHFSSQLSAFSHQLTLVLMIWEGFRRYFILTRAKRLRNPGARFHHRGTESQRNPRLMSAGRGGSERCSTLFFPIFRDPRDSPNIAGFDKRQT